MTLSELRCEYLTNPMGIDTDKPRFSWEIADPRRQVAQTAYRVCVASTREALDSAEADLWDSGRIESDETLHVEYQGKPLASGAAYFWNVQVWTRVPNSQECDMGWSEPAHFSLGLLKASDWQAKWITAPVCMEQSPMHIGYTSLPAGDVESAKWIQIDLGAERSFDGIRLNPAAGLNRNTYSGDNPPGDEFPVRFEITVSDDESMAPCSTVADYTKEAVANPASKAMTIRFPECQGRYVRLTSHLKPRTVFKLAGMEILQGEVDLARGCQATAVDSFEAVGAGFGLSLLTAGKTGYDGGRHRQLRPAPLLRGEFVCNKPIRRAIAYATALGNYQLHINGTRLESFLAPGYTEYEKRVLVQAYDVTALLQPGTNVAGAVLADGWYRSRYRLDRFDQFKEFAQGRFGDAIPRFLLQVQVDYEDGTREISGTDETWRCTMEGPYRKTSMYDGVIYDAQREIPLWDQPTFQDAAWDPAIVSEPACKPYLSPQMVQPIVCREEFLPASIKPTATGTWICDFGQGIGGVCRVTLTGAAGTKVKVSHAMALNGDGSLYTQNLWGAHDNGDVYTLSGKGAQTFTPDFTFHGFRYVEISGVASREEIVEISALMIADNCPVSGTIDTSEARLNKLWKAVTMSYLSCLKSVLVDDADRDERWGWMGDCGTVQAQSMTYNFDTSTFFRRRCRDLMDGQLPNGYFPVQSPGMDGIHCCVWSDALAVMAWSSWLNGGDRRILRETYEAVRKYIFLIASHFEQREPLWPPHHFGDWLSECMTMRPGGKNWDDVGEKQMADALMQTIDLLYLAKLLGKIAATLGEQDDAAAAGALVEKITTDPFIALLREQAPTPGAQSAYALMLGWEIASQEETPVFVKKLLEAIASKGGYMTTGTVTSHLLLNGLSNNGHHDLAYHLAMKPEHPSFGFMVDNDATVLWERFDSYDPLMGINPVGMNGLNHVGFAAVSEWIFASIGGIRPDPSSPGYKNIWIAPKIGGEPIWAKANYHSVRGQIHSSWRKHDREFTLAVTVPPNTTATVFVPAADGSVVTEGGLPAGKAEGVKFLRKDPGTAVYTVASGTYEFHSTIGL